MLPVILIGYSGHAYVAFDIFKSTSIAVAGYMDKVEKDRNPFQIPYLGSEADANSLQAYQEHPFFIGIGDNAIRFKVWERLKAQGIRTITNAIHSSAIINGRIRPYEGIMAGPGVVINSLAVIHEGVICNSGAIIEHECIIHKFAHIAPGAVLAGNVTIGEQSFVGANAVIKQGLTIGKNVIIGAGSVVIHDVPDNVTIVGNPGKVLKKNNDL